MEITLLWVSGITRRGRNLICKIRGISFLKITTVILMNSFAVGTHRMEGIKVLGCFECQTQTLGQQNLTVLPFYRFQMLGILIATSWLRDSPHRAEAISAGVGSALETQLQQFLNVTLDNPLQSGMYFFLKNPHYLISLFSHLKHRRNNTHLLNISWGVNFLCIQPPCSWTARSQHTINVNFFLPR